MRRTEIAEVSAMEGVMLSDAEEKVARGTSAAVQNRVANCPPESDAAPLLRNYFFSAVAGVAWYLQFFFYSMGQTQMGKYEFSSWTMHMASIIIFSTLWGIVLHEWKGTSKRTHLLIAIGLAVLIGSTIIVGYGNYLGLHPSSH
jgi:L-rhamnose-H+ transport protein